jgi:hypothetical protein
MQMRLAFLPLAALAALAACADTAAGPDTLSGELVITEGAAAPVQVKHPRPAFSTAAAAANLGGSSTTPLTVQPQSCDAGEQLVVTYTVAGPQANAASFQVNTYWEFNGTSWTGSIPTTVNVSPRPTPPGAPDAYQVNVTVVNASAISTGTSSFDIVPSGLVTTGTTSNKLNVDAANVTVFVAFAPCETTNTAPTLVLPNDYSVEATSSAGAVVDYSALVTATDLEDGDLTGSVVCTPASNTTFPLGATTVDCSVTDTDGRETTGSFVVTVVDTTPPVFTSFPSGTVNLIAADINGAVLDIDALGITVADVGGVSEPSTFACNYVTGTVLSIGSTTTVDCTATDNAGNESPASSFDVFVGLNVSGTGFLPPLRMEAPFSAHKRGSTIPHKFLPPAYADGTPAADLAGDLRLVVKQLTSDPAAEEIQANDYSAGSTAWRYDGDAGQYIFNLKTGTSAPWNEGIWRTTVSYKGIVLAETQFNLRR